MAEAGGTADGETEGGGWTASSTVFLLGLVAFVGSAAAFGLDVATGYDVTRSLAANGAAALSLVAWAAHDTLGDPDSGVRSFPGALGTALLLFGAYLLVAAVVVGASSVVHGRLDLALAEGIAGLAAVVVGFAAFPAEVVLGGEDESTEEAG